VRAVPPYRAMAADRLKNIIQHPRTTLAFRDASVIRAAPAAPIQINAENFCGWCTRDYMPKATHALESESEYRHHRVERISDVIHPTTWVIQIGG